MDEDDGERSMDSLSRMVMEARAKGEKETSNLNKAIKDKLNEDT